MKKWLFGVGALVGVGAYIAYNKEARERILYETKKGKDAIDVSLEKITSSLNSLDKIKDMSDSEIEEFVDKLLNDEELVDADVEEVSDKTDSVSEEVSEKEEKVKNKKKKRQIVIHLPKEE